VVVDQLLPHSSQAVRQRNPLGAFDIAGTVWTEKENGYNSPGATGYGVRTLVNWVLSNVKSGGSPTSRNAHMYPVGATKDTFGEF